MIEDVPLERSRRQAWARFYAARAECEIERLRAAELAVWMQELGVADGDSPAAALVADVLDGFDDFQIEGIRRYVRHTRAVFDGDVPAWATG